MHFKETRQGFGREQRRISVGNQHIANEILQAGFPGDLHGVTSSVLFFLQRKFGPLLGHRCSHSVCLMPDDDDCARRAERTKSLENVEQESLTPKRVKNLGFFGTHARSLTCRQNDRGDGFFLLHACISPS
jgi:hypothetical protein